MRRGRAWAAGGLLAAAVAAAAAVALLRRGVEVEVGTARRGAIAACVEGSGRARVRERHVVSSPVSGALERVTVHAGDPVRRGDALARVVPLAPTPLDARTRAELEARSAAARAAEREALAALRRAEVVAADAGRELARARALGAGAAASAREVQAAEAAAAAAAQGVEGARAALERARGERVAIEALLGAPRRAARGEAVLTAPESGVVLRVAQESPGPVQPGTPILEVGDPGNLEIALELLTEQASRVRAGAPVEIVGWGGDAPLRGVVRRIEPSAFTKVSALGVEEQRVLVLVDPAAGPGTWAPLGDGWRVEGRVEVYRAADAVQVPASSVFRAAEGWSAFVVSDGRARRRPVHVGAARGDEIEIVSGVEAGERLVLNPSSELRDGGRVRVR
jgi:HlyD family secretion protein